MLKLVKNDKSKVKQQIQNKVLDGIVASNSNLIDDIILAMAHEHVLDCLQYGFPDKRNHNTTIPFNLIMALAVAAKMKTHTSLTDIPYAISDHRTLSELGYNALNTDPSKGWFTEGSLRHLINKYAADDIFNYYNEVVQSHIFETMGVTTDIHILDCTKIAVNKDNQNYENASWTIDRKGNKMFGYKLASLRGLYGDTGLIEEVRFGTASIHDLNLSEDILLNSPMLHPNDVLLMDRGFISRKMINYLKQQRKVDVYIPLRKDMSEYNMAVALAEELDDWQKHPYKKDQMICHVPKVNSLWDGNLIEDYLELNTCVVWDVESQRYFVFSTTDMTKNAVEILKMYMLRTEIEEDFRQIKDFWKLEDFKSTRYNFISFHLVCMLFGYLFYQLYLNTEDGQKYVGKCLPAILKSYKQQFLAYLVLYSGQYFCTMSMREFVEFRDECGDEVKELLLECLK